MSLRKRARPCSGLSDETRICCVDFRAERNAWLDAEAKKRRLLIWNALRADSKILMPQDAFCMPVSKNNEIARRIVDSPKDSGSGRTEGRRCEDIVPLQSAKGRGGAGEGPGDGRYGPSVGR
jgi:hypothetical protein